MRGERRQPGPPSSPTSPAAGERRRSACATDARARESRRILALSPTERALLALDLGDRYAEWACSDLPSLVVHKLATGTLRDELDAAEALRDPEKVDVLAIRTACDRHGLGDALARVLARAGH